MSGKDMSLVASGYPCLDDFAYMVPSTNIHHYGSPSLGHDLFSSFVELHLGIASVSLVRTMSL